MPFQVSVLVLKMNEVNCGIEARGDDMLLAVQATEVIPEQLGNTGMWQYLHSYVGKTLTFFGSVGFERPKAKSMEF